MMGDRMPREAPSPPPGATPGGIKGDDGPRKDGEPIVHRKRGPALPAAPAKSLPLATKNFYKGIRSVAQEAANITGRANLQTDSREDSPACAVGVLVMAVAHGLTDHKNGRISKEDERVAATRKPQAFILSTGQIPPSSMQKIFSCALQGQGALREGSPPAEITSWHGHHQAEQWYASRKSEMLSWKVLDKFQTAEKPGEGGGGVPQRGGRVQRRATSSTEAISQAPNYDGPNHAGAGYENQDSSSRHWQVAAGRVRCGSRRL